MIGAIAPADFIDPAGFHDALLAELTGQHPGVDWQLSVVTEDLTAGDVDPVDLIEAGRDRKLEEDWDFALVLTGTQLTHGREPVNTRVSPVHGVGLISVPPGASGTDDARHCPTPAGPALLADMAVSLLGALLGWDRGDNPDDFVRRARQTTTDVEPRRGESSAAFTIRVLLQNLRLLPVLILANRPWKLAVTLSRALTTAAAAGVITLITTDLWLLATAYSSVKLTGLAAAAIAVVTITLIIGAGLWERARTRQERGAVALFNITTTISVSIGVVTFHLALFALSWTAAAVLVDPSVFSSVIGTPVHTVHYAKLALFTAVLATVGGALGAGLETDDVIRAAAFTRNLTGHEPDNTTPEQ